MVVAELSITPVGEGTSERPYIEAALAELRRGGRDVRVGPFGTAIEAPTLDEVFALAKRAHEAAIAAGARRVLLQVRVDDRRDKEEHLAEQVRV